MQSTLYEKFPFKLEHMGSLSSSLNRVSSASFLYYFVVTVLRNFFNLFRRVKTYGRSRFIISVILRTKTLTQ